MIFVNDYIPYIYIPQKALKTVLTVWRGLITPCFQDFIQSLDEATVLSVSAQINSAPGLPVASMVSYIKPVRGTVVRVFLSDSYLYINIRL